MAAALATAHALGIVHRDLKPENVLLVTPGESGGDFIKLVDFGVSKVKNASLRLTRDNVMLGTPHYMSPEQVRSKEVDERADQFALGAIAYELLCGEVAFAGDHVPAIVYQVTHGEPPRLADPGGLVSPEVDAVLRRALAKERQERYPTVTEFAEALVRAVPSAVSAPARPRASAVTTRRVSAVPVRVAAAGRGPVRALRSRVTLMALLTVGVATAGALWIGSRADGTGRAGAVGLPAPAPVRAAQAARAEAVPAPAVERAEVTPSPASAAPPGPEELPGARPDQVPTPKGAEGTAGPGGPRPRARSARRATSREDLLYNDL
jgi:serine/threonine-protein kinase